MLQQTLQLKQQIQKLEYVDERIQHLKDTYVGKIAVIVAPGPTLVTYGSRLSAFLENDNFVILSIKQAYDIVGKQTDFHILNTYNFDKYNGYNYVNNPIIFYGLSLSYVNEQLQKLTIKPHPCDIWVPIVNPPYITYNECIHQSADFDKFWMLGKETQSWWGTSIMYEQAIPMALHIGCREIITVGWDMGTGAHSYSHEQDYKINNPEVQYTLDSIQTTSKLFDWCTNNNIQIKIASATNPADSRFERINI